MSNQQPLNEELTEREIDILRLMAEGQSNSQIAQQLSLALETVKWYNRRLYEKLSVSNRTEATHRARELGLLDSDNKVVSSSIIIRHNLPAATTAFIGRETELQELIEWMQTTTRLITILAPGGMGKTRLAIELARHCVEHYASQFPDGVFFVPLAQLNNASHIVSAITEQMSLQFYGAETPKEQLLSYFREKQIFLLLDNFEHLLEDAGLIKEILQTAPQVKILVTAREKLNLSDETVYALSGLQFPNWETPEDALEYSAVQLFMQSAKQARMDFELQTSQLDYLARICRLVQGMPLGLILAAGWVEMLSLREIAEEIASSLDFLESQARDLPDRQRSIRAVFEYSWKRLSEEQQNSFMKLSVFNGGFTRKAAATITGANLRTLQTLLSKSLVMRVEDEYYQIHELLRQYAEGELEQSGGIDKTRAAHCKYYLEAVIEREADIKGRRQNAALAEISADFENVRAAWHYAISKEDVDILNRTQEALMWYALMRERMQDTETLLHNAHQQLSSQPNLKNHPIWARMTSRLALMRRWRMGYFEHPADDRAQLMNNLETAHEQNDSFEIALNMLILAMIANVTGEYDEALRLFDESISYFTALEDSFYRAWAIHFKSMLYLHLGHVDQRLALQRESLLIRQAIGDENGESYAICNLGLIELDNGDYEEGGKIFRKLLTRSQDTQHLAMVGISYAWLALIDFLTGDYELAYEKITKALQVGFDMNQLYITAFAHALLGWIACIHENYEDALQFAEQGLQVSRSEMDFYANYGYSLAAFGLSDYETARYRFQLVLRTINDSAGYGTKNVCLPLAALLLAQDKQEQWAVELLGLAFTHERSPLGWFENWSLLARLQEDLRENLGQDAYTAAFERGSQLDLDNVLRDLIEEFASDN